MLHLDRPDVETFLRHVESNTPFVTGDVTRDWAVPVWLPESLLAEVGDLEAQIYDHGFELCDMMSLRSYIDEHFDRATPADFVPYLRWYSRFKDVDEFPWGDSALERLESWWARPEFFPGGPFVLPFCDKSHRVDPVVDQFPARALFVSGKGSATRSHADPWVSDALLVQSYGTKLWKMHAPGRPVSGDPDHQFETKQGDAVYVPAGWVHDVETLTDSISLTWNFVRARSLDRFCAYLRDVPSADEPVIRYFMPADVRDRPWPDITDRLRRALS